MFMIEANEAVAAHLDELGIPTLRRIHPEPDIDAQVSLKRFLRAAGFALKDPTNKRELQKILQAAANTPKEFAVSLATLRSMKKAIYTPEPEGHYGLGSDHYLHFTSPIRRYPDLVVHRALTDLLAGTKSGKRIGKRSADPENPETAGRTKRPGKHRKAAGELDVLRDLGRQCSRTERRAEEAEREYKTVKVLELLQTLLGSEIDGVVTGVTGFGMFVQSTKFLVDGLVSLSALSDDYYEVDENSGSLVGRKTRKVYRIGEPLKVRIAGVDLPRRRLELVPADLPLRQSNRPFARSRASASRDEIPGSADPSTPDSRLPTPADSDPSDTRSPKDDARPTRRKPGRKPKAGKPGTGSFRPGMRVRPSKKTRGRRR